MQQKEDLDFDCFLKFIQTIISCSRDVLGDDETSYIFRFRYHPFYDSFEEITKIVNEQFKHNPPLLKNAVEQRFTRAKASVMECVKRKTGFSDDETDLYLKILKKAYS